jgi:hypothetical protein
VFIICWTIKYTCDKIQNVYKIAEFNDFVYTLYFITRVFNPSTYYKHSLITILVNPSKFKIFYFICDSLEYRKIETAISRKLFVLHFYNSGLKVTACSRNM